MKDNFNIHSWQLKQAITELEETEKIKGKDGKGCWKGYRYAGTENGKDKCVPVNEGEIGLSDILARELFKLQGKISDDLFYKLRKAINSQDPAALAKAKEIMSRIKPEDDRIYMGEEKGQCPECGCEMEAKMCNECGYAMNEGTESPITVLRDIFYFDKLNTLAAKEDVDEKYHRYGTLWAEKGDNISPDSEEYDMLLNSKELKQGIDYTTEGTMNENAPSFYSRDYVEQKYGAEKAKEIEQNIEYEEDNNPNIWDLYVNMQSPEEVDDFVQGFIDESTFTGKYNDDPKLKGGQKDLPDEVQAKIVAKEGEIDEAMFTSANSNNPEGDKLVLRFLQGIAKKFDYPVGQAAIFVKERIKKLGY